MHCPVRLSCNDTALLPHLSYYSVEYNVIIDARNDGQNYVNTIQVVVDWNFPLRHGFLMNAVLQSGSYWTTKSRTPSQTKQLTVTNVTEGSMHKQWANRSMSYICGWDRSEGQVHFRARVIALKKRRPVQPVKTVCVHICVVLEWWLKSAAHTGGDSWWAREIRDKLMPSAFCLLHAPLQHNEPATQALIRPSHWQAYYTTRSPGAGRVEGVPAVGSSV